MGKNCDTINPLYIELYKQQIAEQRISRRTIARQSKLSHTTISNFLDGVNSPTYNTLIAIGDALKVRRIDAFLAVEILKDITSYNQPGMEVLSSLLYPLGLSLAGNGSPIVENFKDRDLAAFNARMIASAVESVASRERALNNFRDKREYT
jgi:transcriptional regulator with XRE-family HTH domain